MLTLALLAGCVEPSGGGPGRRFPDGPEATWGPAPTLDAAPRVDARGRAPPPEIHGYDGPGTPPYLDVDVLVIGAGPAGLAAALEAQRAGASVAILERERDFGGAARWAGAVMIFSGTPVQADAGVTDSATQLLAEWPTFTGGDPADPWVRAFAERNVTDVYDWLVDLGVVFDGPAGDPSSGTTPRIHEPDGGGPAVVEAIERPLGGRVIQFEAEATGLVRASDGRVLGVSWLDLARDEVHVAVADTVIVATGGFLRDLDRIREERPDLADRELYWASWTGSDGNGLALLEAEGAATENLGAIGIYAHGVPSPGSWEELRASALGRVPWLNQDGVRFVDESETNSFAVGALRAQEEDVWAIFDGPSGRAGTFVYNDPDLDGHTLDELVEAGVAVRDDDLATLADALGLDADVVADEVQTFNDAAAGLADDPFRDSASSATPVVMPPFTAVPVAIAAAKGFGGVDVDTSGRVLSVDGEVIPGLYAAGELTGMAGGTLVGALGFTGSMSAVIFGGRVAGAAAAAEALSE